MRTTPTPPPLLDLQQCLDEHRKILEKGLASGLTPDEVRNLAFYSQLIDQHLPRKGPYDRFKSRDKMITEYLRVASRPTDLDIIATELAHLNTLYDRRTLWYAGTRGVEMGQFLNVGPEEGDWILALPEWNVPTSKPARKTKAPRSRR